jgi:hypothetical protein
MEHDQPRMTTSSTARVGVMDGKMADRKIQKE